MTATNVVDLKPRRKRTSVLALQAQLRDAEESAVRSIKERNLYAADTARYKKIAEDAVARAPEFGFITKRHDAQVNGLKEQILSLRRDLETTKHKLKIRNAELRLIRLKEKK